MLQLPELALRHLAGFSQSANSSRSNQPDLFRRCHFCYDAAMI